MILAQYIRRVPAGAVAGVNTLDILAAEFGSDVTDFLTVVNLADMPAGFWTEVASDGSDLYVTTAGDALLPYFLWDFNYGGNTGYLIFKSDMSSTVLNRFKLKYSGGGADQQDRVNSLLEYEAYFLSNAAGTVMEDLVSGTTWASTVTTQPQVDITEYHPIGGFPLLNGNYEQGVTGNIVLDNSVGSNTSFTLGASAKPSILAGDHRNVLSYASGFSASPTRYNILFRNVTNNYMSTFNGADSWLQGTVAAAVGTTVRAHLTQDSTVERNVYIAGALNVTDATVGTVPATLDTVVIGTEDSSRGELFSGNINSLYLRKGVLTADFIAAETANAASPAAFYTIT